MPRRDINDKERIEIVVLFFLQEINLHLWKVYIYILYE